MKTAIFSLGILLAASSVHAGFFDTDYKKELANLDKSKKAATDKVAEAQKQKVFLQKKLAICAEDKNSCAQSGDSEQNVRELMKEADTKIRSYQDKIADIDKKITSTKADEKADNDKKAAEAKEEARKTLEPFKQNAEMLKEEVLNMKFEVSDLGRALDRQWIGNYVAAKMGLMLNSQSFCDSMVRCTEPKGQATKKVSAEQLKKEIFSGMDADLFKGVDFWQKSHEAPATPAAKPAPAATK